MYNIRVKNQNKVPLKLQAFYVQVFDCDILNNPPFLISDHPFLISKEISNMPSDSIYDLGYFHVGEHFKRIGRKKKVYTVDPDDIAFFSLNLTGILNENNLSINNLDCENNETPLVWDLNPTHTTDTTDTAIIKQGDVFLLMQAINHYTNENFVLRREIYPNVNESKFDDVLIENQP